MALKDWNKVGKCVWEDKELNNYNLHTKIKIVKDLRYGKYIVVEKKELNSRDIYSTLNKLQALKFAKAYMKKH